MCIIQFLMRLLNVCFVSSVVAVDWLSASVVPLRKGKGDRHKPAECVRKGVWLGAI